MFLPLVLFLTVLHNIQNVDYEKKISGLFKKIKDTVYEPNYHIVGIITVLQQYDHNYLFLFVQYFGNYIQNNINFSF